MKKEYDFSKGERGKFYHPDTRLNLPIYLEPEAYSFIEQVAERRDKDISLVASDILMTNKHIADMVR